MMQNTRFLEEPLYEALEVLDDILAKQNMPIRSRPTAAAMYFVEFCVEDIAEGGGRTHTKPDDPSDFMEKPWFRKLYKAVEKWYQKRYSKAFDVTPINTVKGVVLAYRTPFLIRVPLSLTRPGETQGTVRVRFPDSVFDDEDVLGWIEFPPNLDKMTSDQLESLRGEIVEVASSLRFIRSRVSSSGVIGFGGGAYMHIEAAAELLLERDRGSIQKAYWELQMACESAFKALLQQKSNDFRETHDLFVLYDDAATYGVSFPRDFLKAVPRWEEMTDLRYALGTRSDLFEALECYRAVLNIIVGVVSQLGGLRIGGAEFTLRQPPWMAT